MSDTVQSRVNAIADALSSVGYEVDRNAGLGRVRVFDPSDASAMYRHIDDAVDGHVDVRMTTETTFHVIVDPRDQYPDQ